MPITPSHPEPLTTRSRSRQFSQLTPPTTLTRSGNESDRPDGDAENYSEDQSEIFEDADNKSRPPSPTLHDPELDLVLPPSPSTSFDELEELLTTSRTPSPSPSNLSTSLGDSDLLPPNHHSKMTSSGNVGDATITGVMRAKDCPVLTAGRITPQCMLSWCRHCERYKLLNNLTEEVVVQHVGGSVQENHLQDWFAAESARLVPLGLSNYLKEFAKHVLPRNWAHRVQEQILSSRQGEKEFSKWRYEMQNLNSVLTMSANVTPLDSRALRAQLTANLSSDLRLYLATDPLDDDLTFDEWAAEVTERDEKLRQEKARNARAARSAFNEWSSTAAKQAGTKKTLADRLEPTNASSSKKFLPKLTEADKELLDTHAGCRRCRTFYAGHTTDDCPMKANNTWPDVHSYVPITAAKAARTASGLVAAVGADEDLEVHDAYIEEYTEDDIAPRDDDTEGYVCPPLDSPTPHSIPHLFTKADISGPAISSFPIRVRAMLDIGCPATVMSGRLATLLGVRRYPLPREEDNLTSLSKAPLRCTHYAKIDFTINNRVWKSEVFRARIVDDLPVPLILGNTFLFQHHIILDVRKRTGIDDRNKFNIVNPPKLAPRNWLPDRTTPPPTPRKSPSPAPIALEDCPEPPLAGYLLPAPIMATVRERIETLSLQEILVERDARLRETYTDRFPLRLPDVVPSDLPTNIYHRIRLKDPNLVVKQRAYAAPKKYHEPWKRVLDAHLAAGRIRPSSSPFSSPAFCIPKFRDGLPDLTVDPRWVNDYRALNSNTIRDNFPLPRVDDILADCGKGKIFGKMDMTNSFFQTLMHPDDIHLTAVRTPWGLYEWVVMPMGGCNAPSTHQQRMTDALRHLIGSICHVYLDDIIIWSSTVEEHEQNVARVLDALRAANLYCNPAKSQLFATEINFLGHVISGSGIHPDPRKTDRILNWPIPTTTTNLRGFLGLTRYLTTFLPALAEFTSILTPLTHKDHDKHFPPWLSEHQLAFDNIKRLVTGAGCLTVIDYDDPTRHIFVTTDASDRRTGAVLSFGETWESARPVAYDSYQLNPAEKNYPVHERELLAIVKALKKWRSSLLGVRFKVYTDHRTLEYFNSQKDMSSRQMRWSTFLSDFDYDIVYVRGEDNTAADALSRMPDDTPSAVFAACSLAYTRHPRPRPPPPPGAFTLVGGVLHISTDVTLRDDILEGYKTDPHALQVRAALEAGSIEGAHSENGLLYVGKRLLVPAVNKVREALYHLAHDTLGHFGFDKTYEALRDSYYWPNMRRDLANAYIPSCTECQRNKDRTTKPVGPLHPLPVPDERFDTVGLDFVGPLPLDQGYDMILTMTDLLGAEVRASPTHSKATAADVALIIFDEWYCENGLMLRLISDRDHLFISAVWRELHKLTGVSIKMSTSYHPQTDGGSERTNKTFIQMLRYMVDQHQIGWVSKLPRMRFAFMNTVNASTGFSPFQLKTGRSPRLIPPIAPLPAKSTVAQRTAHDIMKQIELDVKEAQDHLTAAKIRQAFHANQHRADEIEYKVGDRVMLSTANRRRNYKRKGKKRVAKFIHNPLALV